MRPVILSGMMGTGKSTVGPALAAELGVRFVDTDAEIERASGQRIVDLWHAEGEAAFRAREGDLVETLLGDSSPKVIAFGGGTVTTDRVRRLATDRGIVVTLSASPEVVAARARATALRPNLQTGGDPVARARDLLAQRSAAYAECHMTIRTDDVDLHGIIRGIRDCIRRDPILVPLGVRSYTVDVCRDEPSLTTEAVRRCAPSALVLVTDETVLAARSASIHAALSPLGTLAARVVLKPGEIHKTAAAVGAIWDAALAAKIDRHAVVVALGGGVVGDLAGFAAASLLRGIRFVQVPTTLLAMVDSSVGGKTGCDHPAGKNLIGAFHQPSAVVAEVAHLETLDERHRSAGLAEAVKIAVATDVSMFERLEASVADLARGDPAVLQDIIRLAVRAKIRIVRDDEREAGIRGLLNLGHTVGHALEAKGGYNRWLHGEAVALGTLAEMQATSILGWTPRSLVERLASLFASLGLPTRLESGYLAAAWPFVGVDKKRDGDAVRLPVVTGPGSSEMKRVNLDALKSALVAG